MLDKYEYYGKYDENASGKVKLEEQIRDWLWTADLMLEFIKANRPGILDSFLERVSGKYSTELEGTTFVLDDVGFDSLLHDESVLGPYLTIKELALQIIMKYIPLEKEYVLSSEVSEVKYIDYLRAKHMLLYHRIVALIELLGREEGIQFFKEFVQFWGTKVAEKGKWTVTLKEGRKAAVKFWEESNAFEFGVVDFDDEMYLAKFDKCVWYESMSHVEDKELGYYTVCYPGPRIGRHAHENVRLRRSVTLFTGDFCDELRWNRHVHDEPEQPSHEFSSKIVPK